MENIKLEEIGEKHTDQIMLTLDDNYLIVSYTKGLTNDDIILILETALFQFTENIEDNILH